jgi:hypothetical protein
MEYKSIVEGNCGEPEHADGLEAMICAMVLGSLPITVPFVLWLMEGK